MSLRLQLLAGKPPLRGQKSAPIARDALREIELSDSFLAEHEQLIGRTAYHLLQYALENPRTTDSDLEGALEKLIRTYQTLVSGIYYESLPEAPTRLEPFAAFRIFSGSSRRRSKNAAGWQLSRILICSAPLYFCSDWSL